MGSGVHFLEENSFEQTQKNVLRNAGWRVQTFRWKMNKFWGSNAQHSDYCY